ncbi:VOC family protein [Dactylosporangium sp. CS-033363]|uniref:VOC family protein n=1 Tax=Dactylosporangium sp. CS-033363 TaxID=3239935 RepID=UPI003D8CD201
MPTLELAGVHHVKIPVTDLDRSLDWYRRVFGLRPAMEFRDADGVVRGLVCEAPGLGPTSVGLRVNPAAAEGCAGFDPVSFAVRGRADLEAWAAHLDGLGVEHSPVIEASIGWLLVFADPDGLALHLYTWDEHGRDHADRPGYGRAV